MRLPSVVEALKDVESEHVGVQFANHRGGLKRLSYRELVRMSAVFADGLRRQGVRSGDSVILVMTSPENAIIAILGCMIAGCPPAPIYPPQNLRAIPNFLKFVNHVAARCNATFLVADSQVFAYLSNVPRDLPGLRGMEKFEGIFSGATFQELPSTHENQIAFLQFTSGSTSSPKGVLVTQNGLSENLSMIRKSAGMNDKSTVVTWLPVYHDMGLIGTVLNAITLPCELVVLPPVVFLKKPRLWLELISQFKGTHTASPNFGYGLCVRRVPDVHGLDLSSMTTFICGAEPVLPRTMEAFVEHFRDAGLHPGAMVPAYGLAEATLAVTFSPRMRGLATDEIDWEALTIGRSAKQSVTPNVKKIRISSCGLPMPGLSVRISSDNSNVQERIIGEIQVAGPSVTPGYIGDEDATKLSRTRDGWLRTGDLGYLAKGELYPCGRIKDLIVIRGKNFHAHDLESLASEVPNVRTGNVVAFSVQEDTGEYLVVIAETRTEEKSVQIAHGIRSHLVESIGVKPDEVLVVPAGTLPKTSSGKLKRNETRQLYQQGQILQKKSTFTNIAVAIQTGLTYLKGITKK